MSEYIPGDTVEVRLPDGWMRGTVTRVLYHYLRHGDTRYEVQGTRPAFITITRAGGMRERIAAGEPLAEVLEDYVSDA